jgi:hypothetical protein
MRTNNQVPVDPAAVASVAELVKKAATAADDAGKAAVGAEFVALIQKTNSIDCLTLHGGAALIQAGLEERKDTAACEASLAILTALCASTPKLVEGIIIGIFGSLAECFNDRAKTVRDTTTTLSEVVMKMVSPLAVKTILPALYLTLQHKVCPPPPNFPAF